MKRKISLIFLLSTFLISTFGIHSADAVVNVYNAKNEFVGELISVQQPNEWVVYNPDLDRLIMLDSTSGNILPLNLHPCPYFEENNCAENPYLDTNLKGWITTCDDRIFKSAGNEDIILNDPYRLVGPNFCLPQTNKQFTVIIAEEIFSSDILFDNGSGAGPLRAEHYSGGGIAVQEVPAPAITPHGILLLAGLLGGVGYLAIRRRK